MMPRGTLVLAASLAFAVALTGCTKIPPADSLDGTSWAGPFKFAGDLAAGNMWIEFAAVSGNRITGTWAFSFSDPNLNQGGTLQGDFVLGSLFLTLSPSGTANQGTCPTFLSGSVYPNTIFISMTQGGRDSGCPIRQSLETTLIKQRRTNP